MKSVIFMVLVTIVMACSPAPHNATSGQYNTSALPCDGCISGNFNLHGLPITTRVFFFDTMDDVKAEYIRVSRTPIDKTRDYLGFASYNHVMRTCDIYVIKPKSENDPGTLYLGHEMLHCVFGDYHYE